MHPKKLRIYLLERDLSELEGFKHPMILEEEIRRVKKFLEEAKEELKSSNRSDINRPRTK